MRDLIERQAAIDEIKEFKNACEEWRDEQKQEDEKEDEERSIIWHRADSAIVSALEIGLRIKKRIPSIDAKEIVRCKNCRYNPDNPRPFYDDDPVETYAWCKTEYFGEQGFCSRGKLAITLQPQGGEEE